MSRGDGAQTDDILDDKMTFAAAQMTVRDHNGTAAGAIQSLRRHFAQRRTAVCGAVQNLEAQTPLDRLFDQLDFVRDVDFLLTVDPKKFQEQLKIIDAIALGDLNQPPENLPRHARVSEGAVLLIMADPKMR